MQTIDWNHFGVKGAGKRESFEELCLHLFCRKHKLPEGISGDFNQAGLETEPVTVKGRTYGFQSKHFDNDVDYSQIEKSITTALEKHGKDLDEVCIFINLNAKPHSAKGGKSIEELASKHNVKIQWFTRSSFEVALARPNNLDLAQLYFGIGSEFDFIKDSADYRKITLVKSNEFLKLHFLDSGDRKVRYLEKEALKLRQKLVLVSGDPASGKSTLVHRFFTVYSGMNESSQTKMVNKILANGAVPQIINLKHCISDSLENIIRARQNDFKMRNTSLDIIYLLDGLDEVSEERADLVLLQMAELAKKTNTKKIIVTCRTGNLNRIQLRNYFHDYVEYRIGQLSVKDIDNYFVAKASAHKIKTLTILKAANPKLIESVTDILGLALLWEAIEQLNEDSTVFDLYELKVRRVLKDPLHYKDLPLLNLPNPKDSAILKLNENISYKFQENFQFLFPLKQLQDLVISSYPKADYNSINAIINYIAGLFFDTSAPAAGAPHYVYKHRRYQEYFFIKRLQDKYTHDPLVIRKLSILSNRELFQTFFMKSLRKKYIEDSNLIGCLDLSLLDVYLGNHSGWGVDSPYYLNSDEFISALVNQQDDVFNILFEDESLNLKEKVFINTKELEKLFETWQKDKTDYRTEGDLLGAWQNGLARLMSLVVEFWQAGREDIANDIITNIRAIQKLYDKNKFIAHLEKEGKQYLRDPYWERFEAYLYYLMNIRKDNAQTVLNEQVISRLSPDDSDSTLSDSRENVVDSFLRVLLDSQATQINSVIGDFTQPIMVRMLRLLLEPQRLSIFIKNPDTHKSIKEFVSNYNFELNNTNYHILFFKKYFQQSISDNEARFLQSRKDEIMHERDVDWHMNGNGLEFALIAYVKDEFSLTQELEIMGENHILSLYNERVIFAALFREYITLLNGDVSFEQIYRQYAKYCEINYKESHYSKMLRPIIAKMWAYIYSSSATKPEVKRLLKARLFDELHISKYTFYLTLSQVDQKLFYQTTSESEIQEFEASLDKWDDDFQSKVDRLLQLSLMYKEINPKKAADLFVRAIIDGTLRHGWRKDPIIHYHLVNALDILLEHRWLRGEQVKQILDTVFSLVLRAYEISDGSGTNGGPYRFVEVVARYDRDLAIQYKEKYVEGSGKRNISNSMYASIILSKVSAGFSVEEIEEGFSEFYKEYDFEGHPREDYFEQKFIIYLAIAKSELYFENERKKALESANALIEQMKQEQVSYYLSDSDFRDEKVEFIRLCRQFNIEPNISDKPERETYGTPYSAKNEQKFQDEAKNAKTKQKVRGLYKQLRNHKNNIELKERESWNVLIDKTYETFDNILLFTEYLKSMNYPHTDFYTSNSHHAHLGLAHALGNPDYKQSMMEYLQNSGGHEGFHNLMKAYAELDDREMCLKLFNRYVALCKLLTA